MRLKFNKTKFEIEVVFNDEEKCENDEELIEITEDNLKGIAVKIIHFQHQNLDLNTIKWFVDEEIINENYLNEILIDNIKNYSSFVNCWKGEEN